MDNYDSLEGNRAKICLCLHPTSVGPGSLDTSKHELELSAVWQEKETLWVLKKHTSEFLTFEICPMIPNTKVDNPVIKTFEMGLRKKWRTLSIIVEEM